MSDIVEEMGGYMGDGSEFDTPPMTQIDEPTIQPIKSKGENNE